jgi:hypothetical protein
MINKVRAYPLCHSKVFSFLTNTLTARMNNKTVITPQYQNATLQRDFKVKLDDDVPFLFHETISYDPETGGVKQRSLSNTGLGITLTQWNVDKIRQMIWFYTNMPPAPKGI